MMSPHVKLLEDNVYLEGRILATRLIVDGMKIAAICGYAPTDASAESGKDRFYQLLDETIKEMKKSHPSFKIIIGGDMNATIGNDVTENLDCLGTNNDPLPTNGNGRRLIALCESNNLFMMNTLYATKPIHRVTWYMGTGFKKRTDYILAEGFVKKHTSNCRVFRGASIPFDSDHRMLAMTCNFPTKAAQKEIRRKRGRSSPAHKPNIKSLIQDEEVCSRFSSVTEDLLMNANVDENNVDSIAGVITESIISASEQCIQNSVRPKKPWANEEFLKLIDEQRGCKSPQRKKELSKEIRKCGRKLKNTYYGKQAEELNVASEARDTEAEFRLMKDFSVLKRNNEIPISTHKLEEHFKEHFKEKPISIPDEVVHPHDYPHIIPPQDLGIVVNEAPPDANEAGKAVKRMKNGKCKDFDNIFAEHIKYNSSPTLISFIIMLLTLVWNVFSTPKSWLHSVVTCLYKNKGDKMDPDNYRGLSITATLSKIYTSIIVERMKPIYEALLLPTQFGFRANKSTNDAIYVLRNVIDNTSEELHCCFIDLKAAYDWINRDILFKVLEFRTGLPTLIKLLKCIYVGTSAAIKLSRSTFVTKSGCRQGGMESPSLFNIYLDFVLRCAIKKIEEIIPNPGISINYAIPSQCSTRSQRMECPLRGSTTITHLAYADDIVFFCKNQEELKQMLAILDSEFRRFGLTISSKKTKTMSFNVPSDNIPDSLVMLNGAPIENVKKFPYLGHVVSSEENNHSALITQRIASAYSKFNELKHVLTDRRIRLKTRVKFLTACVRSRLTFSVQACLLKATEISKLESIWTTFLRKLVRNGFKRVNVPQSRRRRGSRRARRSRQSETEENTNNDDDEEDLDWRFRYSNQNILELTNSDPIKNFCQIQHLKYIGHITRLPNSAIQKQILFRTNKKKYARDPWMKYTEITTLTKQQLQREMQDRTRFLPLLENLLGTHRTATVNRGRR